MSKFKVGDRVTPNENSSLRSGVYTVVKIHEGGFRPGIHISESEESWHYDYRFDLAPDPADEAWEAFVAENPYSTRESAFRAGWRASE